MLQFLSTRWRLLGRQLAEANRQFLLNLAPLYATFAKLSSKAQANASSRVGTTDPKLLLGVRERCLGVWQSVVFLQW